MTTPNLFRFATSELSQDAAIAWHLAWADPDYRDADPALYACGQRLLASLLARSGITVTGAFTGVRVYTQRHRVDVAAEVTFANRDQPVLLLIEDKATAGLHGDQLAVYAKEAKARHTDHTIARILLKTHDDPLLSRPTVGGWATFGRSDLLEALTGSGAPPASNEIHVAFVEHLEAIERAHDPSGRLVTAFAASHWRGFYSRLQKRLKDEPSQLAQGSWGYVPNRSGGFIAYWTPGRPVLGGRLFAQIEQDQLVVKVHAADGQDRKHLRTALNHLFLDAAGATGLPFTRPARFGHGAHMAIARLGAGDWLTDAHGMADVGRAARTLAQAAALVELVADGKHERSLRGMADVDDHP